MPAGHGGPGAPLSQARRAPEVKPGLDEVLALDLVCLEAPAGGPLDAEVHRTALGEALARAEWACVRRSGALVAYGYLWRQAGDTWFVGGLAIHPDHRTAPVTAELGRMMAGLVRALGVGRLESHVRRNNAASLRLHRRLGFAVEQENEMALAFAAESATLLARLPG